MSENKCLACQGAVSAGTPVCASCRAATSADLNELSRITREVTITLTRQGNIGRPLRARTTGVERPLPFDFRAERWFTRARAWAGAWAGHTPPVWLHNAIERPGAYARWLEGRWEKALLGRDDVGAFMSATRRLAETGRQIIDIPPDRYFIGTCSQVLETYDGTTTCDEDLYAREGAGTATCPQCLTVHDVADRRQALREAVEGTLATAYEISRAVHLIENPLTPSAIHNHHHRGRLPRRGVNANGEHLYRVGDVLSLAAELAGKRAASHAGTGQKKR